MAHHWEHPFISSCLLREDEEQPLHSLAASHVCFCRLIAMCFHAVQNIQGPEVALCFQPPADSCVRSALPFGLPLQYFPSAPSTLPARVGSRGRVFSTGHPRFHAGPPLGAGPRTRTRAMREITGLLWHLCLSPPRHPLQGDMVSDQGEVAPCQVVPEILYGPLYCEGFSFHGGVLLLGRG